MKITAYMEIIALAIVFIIAYLVNSLPAVIAWFIIAAMFTLKYIEHVPQRMLDLAIKLGLISMTIFLIVFISWGFIEYLIYRGSLKIPISEVGQLEYLTFWGSLGALIFSLILFTTALFIHAVKDVRQDSRQEQDVQQTRQEPPVVQQPQQEPPAVQPAEPLRKSVPRKQKTEKVCL